MIELPDNHLDNVLSARTTETDPTNHPQLFASAWETTTTRHMDPFIKNTVENCDPIDLSAFRPIYSDEPANHHPRDWNAFLRRAITERDTDTGMASMTMYARSIMWDLHYPHPATRPQRRDSIDAIGGLNDQDTTLAGPSNAARSNQQDSAPGVRKRHIDEVDGAPTGTADYNHAGSTHTLTEVSKQPAPKRRKRPT